MILGHVTLSGLDDGALIILIEGKKSYSGFTFDPATMEMQASSTYIENRSVPLSLYKNVTLAWRDDKGLKAVETLLGKLRLHEQANNGAARIRL